MINLEPEHRSIVLRILNELVPTSEVRVFGSRADGAAKPYSDLDLVVMTTQPLGPVLADLTSAFSESDLPYKVDVIDWAATQPHFQQIIQGQSVPLKEQG